MAAKTDEISAVIRDRIENFELKMDIDRKSVV